MVAATFSAIPVYDNVNPEIVALYANEKVVLDVGCGSGALGAYLKELNSEAIVHGIDISAESGKVAAKVLDSFHCLDADRDPLPEYGVKFDLIILGDVLEHLKRPDLFLGSLHAHLAPAGAIVLSVPNVAHYLVRKKLLFGDFNYASTGIMDRTHLRFFTYRTIVELIQERGYFVADRRVISNCSAIWNRFLYRLVAVQFVFKIMRNCDRHLRNSESGKGAATVEKMG